jgi:asparagine synthase (glutamine-hydrolysing)
MCGITGFYSTTKRFNKKNLEAMTAALAHRGPDHSATHLQGNVGLGHRRLSILDPSSSSNQPMRSANQRYLMTYNGEVYNFREIAEQLNIALKTTGDTEVLLEAFSQWGPDFIHRLNGMFAIAIYDTQENVVHLWRDRIGIKPLYYFYNEGNFAFASELKALLTLPIEKKINREAIADFLFLEYIPEPLTPLRYFFKLEKGHYLKVDRHGITRACYYNLLEQFDEKRKIQGEKEVVEVFDQQFTSSVKYRTVSDVPIGAFLSGGNDSSAICSKFQEVSSQPITAFTIGFEEKKYDESEYAKAIAKHLGIQHEISHISPSSSLGLVNRITAHYDEPFAVSSVIPMLQLSQFAAKQVKVVMSGDGGDELFMGYGYYRWSERMTRMAKFGMTGKLAAAQLLELMGNRGQRAARMFKSGSASRPWLHLWSQEQYMFTEKEIGGLLGEHYQHRTTTKDHDAIWALDKSEFDKIALFDLRHYLANNLLHKVDIASMAYGLEARVPFLDHNMVEFAINQRQEFKINGDTQKYLLKKWLAPRLPEALIYRKKWGFPAPVELWLQHELRHLIDQYLSKSALDESGLFNTKQVSRLVQEFRNGKVFHYKRIWALISFQMWFERYMK